LLVQEAFALIPAPGLHVPLCTSKPDLVRQLCAREGEQFAPKRAALILRRDEDLIELEPWQMQREHGGECAVVVGDIKAPAVLDLLADAGAQIRQQEVAGLGKTGGDPAF